MPGRWLVFVLYWLYGWSAAAAAAGDAAAAASWPRAVGTDFRVLVWNVSREDFFTHRERSSAALQAIAADVLILDEMSAERRASDLRGLLDDVDGDQAPTTAPWHISWGSSGYRQRTVFAVRGALDPLPQFRFLAYPQTYLKQARGWSLKPEHRQLLDADLAAGIAAHGAIARIGGRSVLLVGVDLQCCGDSDDAWQEQRRLIEVAQIRAALDTAWTRRRPQAVLVGGDFNAVRGLGPTRVVQGKGTPAARSARRLERVRALHADGVSDWTWDGRGTPFPSRAIDFLLHSNAVEVRQALVFDPETMSAAQRAQLGLAADLLKPVSEHRPLVVDLRWR